MFVRMKAAAANKTVRARKHLRVLQFLEELPRAVKSCDNRAMAVELVAASFACPGKDHLCLVRLINRLRWTKRID